MDILDAEEAIEFLKTSKPTFYRWLKSGKIHGFRAGKQWRFYKSDLIKFMESAGTDFVSIRNEFCDAIDFFFKRLEGKGINIGKKGELL